MNPWADVYHLRDSIVPWVWGDCTAGGGGYPAPVIGFIRNNKLYFGTDYIDESGGYELAFGVGSLKTGQGSGLKTETGYTIWGPENWWHSFASSEEEGPSRAE